MTLIWSSFRTQALFFLLKKIFNAWRNLLNGKTISIEKTFKVFEMNVNWIFMATTRIINIHPTPPPRPLPVPSKLHSGPFYGLNYKLPIKSQNQMQWYHLPLPSHTCISPLPSGNIPKDLRLFL